MTDSINKLINKTVSVVYMDDSGTQTILVKEIMVYSEKSIPVLGVKNAILAIGKKKGKEMECSTETIAFGQKGLYPWYGYG